MNTACNPALKEVFMVRHEHILVQSDDGVTTITLNRPEKRNALSPALIEELIAALEETASSECSAVILAGAGPAFCAGLDIEYLDASQSRTAAQHRRDSVNIACVLRMLYDFPKPVIAAVNGPAIGSGMSLATIPAFTLATPWARFAFNEVRMGFVPAVAAMFLLRQVGEKRIRDLLLTGRMLKAQEAMQMGLVTEVVAAEELMQAAHSLAKTLQLNSPHAMQSLKQLLAMHSRRQLDEEIEEAIEVNAQQRTSADFEEGVKAFLEQRRAEWPSMKGRA
jgi:methylglutaconyl-CoA hydratase